MPGVHLRGELICADEREVDVVTRHLPDHVAATRAEPGCESFEVERVGDSPVWRVRESFRDAAAFKAHQDRVAASDWGRATAGVERRYEVDGL